MLYLRESEFDPTDANAAMEVWEDRRRLIDALQELKTMTKQHSAQLWDDAYRDLANRIHAVNRDLLGVERDEETWEER